MGFPPRRRGLCVPVKGLKTFDVLFFLIEGDGEADGRQTEEGELIPSSQTRPALG